MSVFHNNILAGASGASGAAEFKIERSLRFNDADTAYLNRTPSSASNRRTWTWSGWLKKCAEDTKAVLFTRSTDSSNRYVLSLYQGNFYFYSTTSGSQTLNVHTSGEFRDPSAWYHVVFVFDTTQATANDRTKIYVNGVQPTLNYSQQPSQNAEFAVNTAAEHRIGGDAGSSEWLNGYLTEVNFVDGQALAASDFGEYDDNNVWQPKEYTGSHGTNGFHLKFDDNSTNAALGNDSSGNDNDWTVNNIRAAGSAWNQSQTWSSSLSSTTGFRGTEPATNAFDGDTSTVCSAVNDGVVTFTSPVTFASDSTIRVIVHGGDHTVTVNGGSDQTISAGSYQTVSFTNSSNSTFTMTFQRDTSADTGIRAIEIGGNVLVDSSVVDPDAGEIDSLIDSPMNYTASSGNNGGNYCNWNPLNTASNLGLANGNLDTTSFSGSSQAYSYGTIGVSSGKWYYEATPTSVGAEPYYMVGWGRGDKLTSFGSDEYLYYSAALLRGASSSAYGAQWTANDVIGVALDLDAGTLVYYKNGVSQGTAFTGITGTVFPKMGYWHGNGSFNFGQRPFAYTPPSGYKALCTQNLPDPTIADGSDYFDITTFNNSGQTSGSFTTTITPDLIIMKRRDSSSNWVLQDIVRGYGDYKNLHPNLNIAETSTNNITSVSNKTVSYGSNTNMFNTQVAWYWDAGTSTASNTDGTVTSSVRANTSAGFSICAYTSPNSSSNQSFGHGLNAKPDFVIVKNRDSSYNWDIYHSSLGYNASLIFTGAATRSGAFSAEPTSTVVNTKHDYTHVNTDDYIAYCWTAVEGYSAFGSYTGNGNSDGPFVYTGFRPRWILVKASSSVSYGNWIIHDTERSPHNESQKNLYVNLNNLEDTSYKFDILSNGFKIRSTAFDGHNGNGSSYTYAAFAEHPFKTARAR